MNSDRFSDAFPGVSLAALFFIFAFLGSEMANGSDAASAWRVTAGVIGVAVLMASFYRTHFRVRIFAGAISVTWIMLWAIHSMWATAETVSVAPIAFLIVLAVFATSYWSRSPMEVPSPAPRSHASHAAFVFTHLYSPYFPVPSQVRRPQAKEAAMEGSTSDTARAE